MADEILILVPSSLRQRVENLALVGASVGTLEDGQSILDPTTKCDVLIAPFDAPELDSPLARAIPTIALCSSPEERHAALRAGAVHAYVPDVDDLATLRFALVHCMELASSDAHRLSRLAAARHLGRSLAHDLNNVLGSISSLSQFLLEDIPEDDPRHGDAAEISRATERGLELSRLLAHAAGRINEEACATEIGAVLETVRERLAISAPGLAAEGLSKSPAVRIAPTGLLAILESVVEFAVRTHDDSEVPVLIRASGEGAVVHLAIEFRSSDETWSKEALWPYGVFPAGVRMHRMRLAAAAGLVEGAGGRMVLSRSNESNEIRLALPRAN